MSRVDLDEVRARYERELEEARGRLQSIAKRFPDLRLEGADGDRLAKWVAAEVLKLPKGEQEEWLARYGPEFRRATGKAPRPPD